MDTIAATTLTDTKDKVTCDCGYRMSTLPPDRTWRKVACQCGTIWWVKPSGGRFEKQTEQQDFDY